MPLRDNRCTGHRLLGRFLVTACHFLARAQREVADARRLDCRESPNRLPRLALANSHIKFPAYPNNGPGSLVVTLSRNASPVSDRLVTSDDTSGSRRQTRKLLPNSAVTKAHAAVQSTAAEVFVYRE